MACCGGHRTAQRTTYTRPTASANERSSTQSKPVTFAYTGTGSLSVKGPLTGATYRFAGHGSRVSIHPSDASSLVSVPGLKPVR